MLNYMCESDRKREGEARRKERSKEERKEDQEAQPVRKVFI